MEPSPLHKRAVLLMFFLFLWAALVAARLFYLTVIARADNLEAGERLSMRSGRLPAMRGRILDGEGTLLAWSERRVDICLTEIPVFAPRRKRLERVIRVIVPNFSISTAEKGMILKKNISPEEHLSIFRVVAKYRELVFLKSVERKTAGGAANKSIGSVVTIEEVARGVSGYEKLYDDKLRGRDGAFKVMVDRSGRWIPGTWRETLKPVNGKDVVVE